jgi:hypothetical protein
MGVFEPSPVGETAWSEHPARAANTSTIMGKTQRSLNIEEVLSVQNTGAGAVNRAGQWVYN